MKLLQINTVINSGSTGRIAEDIGRVMMDYGHESIIAFGRGDRSTSSDKLRVGNTWDTYYHVFQTRVHDNHGFGSRKATKALVHDIEALKPDAIGLHNLHGYYLHVEELFLYLKTTNIPTIWTLHDCWAFTGHCAHYMGVNCEKWKTHCRNCPLTHKYPKSWFRDRSFKNFHDKRNAFTGHPNLTLITPSRWLESEVEQSFLKEYPVKMIHNGIDLNTFRPVDFDINSKIVLGVASVWSQRKGLDDFIYLRSVLSDDIEIVLIGLSNSQIRRLPGGIKGISRTENIDELAIWYSRATVFVNPTYLDNFPTTNIEALACGTPVITYATGGSPEAVDSNTGIVVPRGDLIALADAVEQILQKGKNKYRTYCRQRAESYFNKEDRFGEYKDLYESKLKN